MSNKIHEQMFKNDKSINCNLCCYLFTDTFHDQLFINTFDSFIEKHIMIYFSWHASFMLVHCSRCSIKFIVII